MESLLARLTNLRDDLERLVDADPEQELDSPALELADATLVEAVDRLPKDSTLRAQVEHFISPTAVGANRPLRAADALVVIGQVRAAVSSSVTADLELYRELTSILDLNSEAIDQLKDHDFRGHFRWDWFDHLRLFRREWDRVDHRFNDSELDRARSTSHSAVAGFMARLVEVSGRAATGAGWYVVGPSRDSERYATAASEQFFLDRAEEVNDLASAAYDRLVKVHEIARSRLGL